MATSIKNAVEIAEDYKGSVVFNGESAGYKNAVGMYTYDDKGAITGVKIIWANASLKDSGGDLVANKSSADVALASGQKVGFFVVPDAFSQSGMDKILSSTNGTFSFVDKNGKPGNINAGGELKLVYTNPNGVATDVKGAYGTTVFHSVDDGSKGLNGDGLNHVKLSVDTNTGALKIGFEDLKNGGDKDYDDSVITVNVGAANAKAIASGDVKGVIEKAAAEKAAAEKAAAEKAAAEKAAAEKAAAEKAAAEKVAAEKAAADKIAADEKAAAEKAAADLKASGELLVDGSFEQAKIGDNTWGHQKVVGGWHSDTEVEVWGKDFLGVKATDGVKVAELDYDRGQSNIYQDVQTKEGEVYTFAFDSSQRGGTASATNTIEVYWNGEKVGSVTPESANWTRTSFEVKGTGGTDRIEFREEAGDNDSLGGLIDNVSLKASPVTLSLDASDAANQETGVKIVGGKDGDGLTGGAGNDQVFGLDGDDKLNGDDVSSVTLPLDIKWAYTGAAGAAGLTFVIANVPAGSVLSAGKDNGDGSWTLNGKEIEGLKITAPDQANFSLKVSVSDALGRSAVDTIDVKVNDGNQDVIAGGKGNDVINGNGGSDSLYGGSIPTGEAKPHVATYADDDVIYGGDGDDKIWGNSGDDQLFGDNGNDVVSGGKGNDYVEGGEGNDVLTGNTGDDTLVGGDGNDLVNGNAGNDILIDGRGNDKLVGDSGDDVIFGGEGDDVYEGKSGFDTIDFSAATGSMKIDMSKKVADGMGHDSLLSIERVVGSSFDDFVKGSSKADSIDGGDGNDVIRSLGGADHLSGGAGDDTFVYFKKDAVNDKGRSLGVDRISDFQKGDTLDLHDMLKDQKYGKLSDVVHVTDGDNGATVSVKIGGKFVDVVTLDGVHADDLLHSGMILT